MVYICVICMVTQTRLWTLNGDQRQILAAIVSTALKPGDMDRLKNILLLACSDCTQLVQNVVAFQNTAHKGVKHLLSLLPSVQAAQDSSGSREEEMTADPLLQFKEELPEKSLLKINFEMEMELEHETLKPITRVDLKLESLKSEAAPDLNLTGSANSDVKDNWLNTDNARETTGVQAGQNAQAPSTSATPDISLESNLATLTHDPEISTPNDNTVYNPIPPGSTVYGSDPTNCVQNYQINQRPHLTARLRTPVVIQGNLAHHQMYNQQMYASQPRPLNVPFGNAVGGLHTTSHLPTLPTLVVNTAPATHRPANMVPVTGTVAGPYVLNAKPTQNMPMNQLNPELSEGGYSCGICGYCANTPTELRAHASRHSTRFCCSYCPFRTVEESVIRQHYCDNMPHHRKPKAKRIRIRKPPGAYKCTECGARFADEDKLKGHMERLHSNPSDPITCNICNKEWTNKYKYKMHMHRHKKQEERSLDTLRPELFCAECVREFESKTALDTHMQTLKHSTRDQWRFECDTCGSKFMNKQSVRSHILRIHLRLQNYKCELCLKKYSMRPHLRKHQLTHAAAPAPRPHVCHLCAKTFTIKKSLTEHLSMHAGLRPHQCPLCPATFTYSAALYTHNRLKHLKIKRNLKKKPKKKIDAKKSAD